MSTRKSLKISLEIIIIFWICRLTTHLANVASCFPLCQFTQAPQFPTTTSPISSGFPKLPTPPGPFPSGLTSGVSPTSTSHSPSFPISNHHFTNFFRLPQTSNTTWSIPFRPYLPNFHLPLPKLPHFQPPLLQFLQASPNFQHHLVHSLQALPQVSPQLPPPTPQASPFPTTTSPISSGFPKLPTPPGPFPSGLTSGVSPTSTSHSPSFPISNHHFSNFFRLPQISNTTWSIPFRPYLRCLPNFHLPLLQASPFPTTTSPISSGFPKLPTPSGPFPSGLTSGVSPTSTSFPISNHHFSNFFRLPQTSNTHLVHSLQALPPNFHLPLPKLPHFQPPLLQFLQASPNFQHHLVHSLSGLTSGVSPTSTSHSPSFPISNHHFSNFFRLPQTSNTTWSIPFRPHPLTLTASNLI